MSTPEREIRPLEDISEKQWREIEALAQALAKADTLNRNVMRCIVPAFFSWLQDQSFDVALFTQANGESVH
jgi:hypothetical protein